MEIFTNAQGNPIPEEELNRRERGERSEEEQKRRVERVAQRPQRPTRDELRDKQQGAK